LANVGADDGDVGAMHVSASLKNRSVFWPELNTSSVKKRSV